MPEVPASAFSAPNGTWAKDSGGHPALVVAVDLGATHTRVGLARNGGFEGVTVKLTAELARAEGEGVVPGVIAAVRETVGCAGVDPEAIGVAVAAYVDPLGVVLQERPCGIPAGPALRDRLSASFGVPVAVDNDANMAALAEVTLGAGRDLSNVAVITLGTNIGLGIIAGGQVLRGAHGAAGEAGTLLVPVRRGRDGRAAMAEGGRLGSGRTTAPDHYAILEELVGGGALLGSIPPAANPSVRNGIFPRAAAGDRHARQAVAHAIEGWAMLIADLAALLDPQVFVISGGFVVDAPAFIEPLRRRAEQLCELPPDIRIGDFGAESGLVGAAVAARSILRPGAAQAAAPDRPDRSNQGRASGQLAREVES
jgi:glucokinase